MKPNVVPSPAFKRVRFVLSGGVNNAKGRVEDPGDRIVPGNGAQRAESTELVVAELDGLSAPDARGARGRREKAVMDTGRDLEVAETQGLVVWDG